MTKNEPLKTAKRNYGAYAWDKNPWVWVYEFERITVE